MKTIYIVLIIALLGAMMVTPTAAATTWYVDDDGGYDYTSILDAMNAASEGDTIFVYNGTYGQFDFPIPNVRVIGEGADVVTVDCGGGEGICMPRGDSSSNATGCILDGFTVINTPSGVRQGVYGLPSPNCIIRNCVFDGMTASAGMVIHGDNTTFENNIVSNFASSAYGGIGEVTGKSCTFVNNTFINIPGSWGALYIRPGANFTTIDGNTFINCTGSRALILREVNNCVVVNNTFIDNAGDAIRIWKTSATDNTITKNNITSNGGIIYLKDAGEGNKIYLNDFIDNTAGVTYYGTPPTTIYWNSTEEIEYVYGGTTYTNYLGNNWSAYGGVDTSPEDGIGDTAYDIAGSSDKDHRPLMAGFENYPAPVQTEVLFEGTVTLANETTFTYVPSNNASASYTVSTTTDLGALTATGLALNASDKWYASYGSFSINSIGGIENEPWVAGVSRSWAIFVNDAQAPKGLGGNNLVDGDNVKFYFCPWEGMTALTENATYLVNITVNVVDILFEGTVTLTKGTTFTYVPSNNASASYTMSTTTDLGALTATGLALNASDSWYASYGSFSINSIGGIENEPWVAGVSRSWAIFVNDAQAPKGLGGNNLVDGDNVKFYFCPWEGMTALTENATYLVNITVVIPAVTSLTITPNTGTTSEVQAYDIIVNTTGFTSLNVTIPAGFGVETPSGQIARVDLWWANEEDPHYGYVTFTANATDKMDVYAYIGETSITYPGMAVNYTEGATTSIKSPFGSHAERANLTFPTASANGYLKISGLPDTITNITVSIGEFVQNPDSTATYTFTAKADGEAVGKSATVTIEAPSPCFIATAAYGTPLHEDIDVLRDFRNEYLMTNPVGRAFVKTYYTTSPPIADALREHEGLRAAVREGLIEPLVYMSRVFVTTD